MSRELRLGLFIVATMLMLTAGVFLIGSKELLFRRTYRVRAGFPNVGGLIDGAVVSVGGIGASAAKEAFNIDDFARRCPGLRVRREGA